MREVLMRPPGVVIKFPDAAARPLRPHLSADEPRGEILLFTGVRYERLGPTSGPSHFSDGSRRRRRS